MKDSNNLHQTSLKITQRKKNQSGSQGKEKNGEDASAEDFLNSKTSFSLFPKSEAPKSKNSGPFFSNHRVDGEIGAGLRKSEPLATRDQENVTELPSEINLNGHQHNLSFDPILSAPKPARDLHRDLQTERSSWISTGLEKLQTKEQEAPSDNLESFRLILGELPRFRILEELIEDRFDFVDSDYDGVSSEFEYDAINEIQARNRIPEEHSDIIDNMWENIITHTVANRGTSDATKLVDEIITKVPFAAPPSRALCDSLELPQEWRAQFD